MSIPPAYTPLSSVNEVEKRPPCPETALLLGHLLQRNQLREVNP